MLAQPVFDFQKVNNVFETPFQKFHHENPAVYAYLRDTSLRLVRRGVRHWTIRNLWECMRMDHAIRTNGEPWKLNNNLTASYARLLMEQEPELAGWFEVRG